MIKKLKINFESLVLPIDRVSSYHTSTPNTSLEDKEIVAGKIFILIKFSCLNVQYFTLLLYFRHGRN